MKLVKKDNYTYFDYHMFCLIHSCFTKSQVWECVNTNCKKIQKEYL